MLELYVEVPNWFFGVLGVWLLTSSASQIAGLYLAHLTYKLTKEE